MDVMTSVAAQIQKLRKINVPTERDHALKKNLHRRFEVYSDGADLSAQALNSGAGVNKHAILTP